MTTSPPAPQPVTPAQRGLSYLADLVNIYLATLPMPVRGPVSSVAQQSINEIQKALEPEPPAAPPAGV